MVEKLKVGIAGYGVVGKRRRICIDKHPHLKLIAVCDRHFTENSKFEDGVLYYNNYKDLLTQDLDILLVCLTNDMAAEVCIAGLENSLHVFCEKPPGRNLADIIHVRKCKQKYSDLQLMYGFNHRHHHSVIDALKIMRSQELGKIINLKGVYGKSKLVTFNQSDWRTKREIAGGGVLLDQGIHLVDLMRLFAGEFSEVYSFVSNNYWNYDVEDNAYALMKTADGVVGMLHSSATQWRHRFELDINFEKGSLILGGILSGSKSYGDETLKIIWADHNGNGDPREQLTRYNTDPSWEEEIRVFIQAIHLNQPLVSGSIEDAYKTMALVSKIYSADKVWMEKWQSEKALLVDITSE
ncbi:MAG: oxidoreductase [Gammaproteobacteria bacterium RIFCSPHIGHO2_12_FULL_35_23]|nr:MAG: oxidoreductase [Gammaproteobacteria bacterium RIFCSPHIGHO2_12_FULL_35_23]